MLRWLGRRTFVALVGPVALGGAVLAAACVNPQDDYNNWLATTADARAVSVESGTYDGGLPEGSIVNQLYFMVCGTEIDPVFADTSWFVATMSFTPTGSGGTLDFKNQPLSKQATDLTGTVGDPSQDFTNVAPGDDGRFDLDFGPNTIPAADDSLQPQPIVFSDSVLHILLESDGTACANLSGTILSPIQLSLTPDKNICRFVAMSSTSQSLPTLPDSEFAPGSCP